MFTYIVRMCRRVYVYVCISIRGHIHILTYTYSVYYTQDTADIYLYIYIYIMYTECINGIHAVYVIYSVVWCTMYDVRVEENNV